MGTAVWLGPGTSEEGPDLPVFRGDDERDTRSCQLCFLPRELLFSVSWAGTKGSCVGASHSARHSTTQPCPPKGYPAAMCCTHSPNPPVAKVSLSPSLGKCSHERWHRVCAEEQMQSGQRQSPVWALGSTQGQDRGMLTKPEKRARRTSMNHPDDKSITRAPSPSGTRLRKDRCLCQWLFRDALVPTSCGVRLGPTIRRAPSLGITYTCQEPSQRMLGKD